MGGIQKCACQAVKRCRRGKSLPPTIDGARGAAKTCLRPILTTSTPPRRSSPFQVTSRAHHHSRKCQPSNLLYIPCVTCLLLYSRVLSITPADLSLDRANCSASMDDQTSNLSAVAAQRHGGASLEAIAAVTTYTGRQVGHQRNIPLPKCAVLSGFMFHHHFPLLGRSRPGHVTSIPSLLLLLLRARSSCLP